MKGDIDIMLDNPMTQAENTDYEFLEKTQIFENISREGIKKLLECSGAMIREYEKGQVVFREGEKPEYFYLLLKGKLLVTKNMFMEEELFSLRFMKKRYLESWFGTEKRKPTGMMRRR